jgi:hypothetical protein
MCFGVGLLDEWYPRLVCFAMREIQCFASALQALSEFVFINGYFCAFFLGPAPITDDREIVVIAHAQVQFVIDDFVDPFSI